MVELLCTRESLEPRTGHLLHSNLKRISMSVWVSGACGDQQKILSSSTYFFTRLGSLGPGPAARRGRG